LDDIYKLAAPALTTAAKARLRALAERDLQNLLAYRGSDAFSDGANWEKQREKIRRCLADIEQYTVN